VKKMRMELIRSPGLVEILTSANRKILWGITLKIMIMLIFYFSDDMNLVTRMSVFPYEYTDLSLIKCVTG
jgi:hypothetical protein